jgi:hypothetical protein
LLLDSFWRALAYCLHPRVVLLSLMPLALMILLWLTLGYFFWEPAIDGVRAGLEGSTLLSTVWGWFESLGIAGLKTVVAPLVVIFAATPVIVMLSLLLVAFLMTPALVSLVARRRFPELARERGASWMAGLFWALGSLLLACVALVISIPLWLVPPLILVLPPLIWGWLTYRVMAFDALAEHASTDERREIFRRHRLPLLIMGLLTGYLGAAPSLVWASGALFAAAFVILAPLAIWIYTFIFALSSLWFTHYCLGALQQLRAQAGAAPATVRDVIDVSSKVLTHEPSEPLSGAIVPVD